MIELDLLREEVASCTKCQDLVANRTQTVFSDGDCHAELMIIAEAPGSTEDQKGIPFCGDSGDLLNNILRACKLSREKVYIANMVKCRPPNNRTPTDDEISNCRKYLDRQIELVKPKYLLLLGSVASKTILGGGVGSLRGKWYIYMGISTLTTYHPSYLIRTPEDKKKAGEDFRMLLDKMGGTCAKT